RQASARSDLSVSLYRIAMNLRVLAILVEARQAMLDVDNKEPYRWYGGYRAGGPEASRMMSAFGCKADVHQRSTPRPLLTQRGQRSVERFNGLELSSRPVPPCAVPYT